jgi:hypothetical protein
LTWQFDRVSKRLMSGHVFSVCSLGWEEKTVSRGICLYFFCLLFSTLGHFSNRSVFVPSLTSPIKRSCVCCWCLHEEMLLFLCRMNEKATAISLSTWMHLFKPEGCVKLARKLKISNVQNESYQDLTCEIQILFILVLKYITFKYTLNLILSFLWMLSTHKRVSHTKFWI